MYTRVSRRGHFGEIFYKEVRHRFEICEKAIRFFCRLPVVICQETNINAMAVCVIESIHKAALVC